MLALIFSRTDFCGENLLGPTVSRSGQLQNLKREHGQEEGSHHDKPRGHYDPGPRGSLSSWGSEALRGY